MKPTKTQMKVLHRMGEGWELGVSTSMEADIWLRHPCIGFGGHDEKVHTNTFNGLANRSLIRERKYGFPASTWELTDKGIEALK